MRNSFCRMLAVGALVCCLPVFQVSVVRAQSAPPAAITGQPGTEGKAGTEGQPGADNFVINGGFETKNNLRDDKGDRMPGAWTIYGSRTKVVEQAGRGGGKALEVVRPAKAKPDEMDGAAYVVQWEKSWKWPLVVSAWSKAEDATPIGATATPTDYALYCDIVYEDGSTLFARTAPFKAGTHDWEQATVQILPEKPFKSLTVYLLFRGNWSGRVLFDDVQVRPSTDVELQALSQSGRPLAPKIIEFGWDMHTVTPAFVRDNWREMEKQPFDGVVMPIGDTYLFDADKRDDSYYKQALQDLKDVKWTKFTDNFAILHANPGTVDFFDPEWDNIVASTAALARFTRAAGFKGICFDPEAYVEPNAAFSYPHQKYHDKYTFDQYWDKARERGRQWMQALQENHPGLTLLTLFGPSANWNLTKEPDLRRALQPAAWGLYVPFMDGMLDVIQPNVRFVDGCEWGYYMTDRQQFLDGFHRIKNDCQVFFSPENRAKYRAQVYVGFGLYPDRDWGPKGKGWHPEDPAKNYYPPEKFRENLYNAVTVADEYVWVYTEGKRNWWKPQESDLPPAYVEALQQGRWTP